MSGKPLLLIHGFTDSSRSWSLIAPYLLDFSITMIDLPGHGDSSQVDELSCYCLWGVAKDLNELMDRIGLTSAIVVGHSLGSIIAGIFSVYYPHRSERLVLISTATAIPDPTMSTLEENVVKTSDIAQNPDSDFVKEWFANPTAVDSTFMTYQYKQCAQVPLSTWISVLRTMSLTNWTYVAKRIPQPTLILWGTEDPIFGEDTQCCIKNVVAKAEFISYDGYGHNMFWECPMKVAEDIRLFVSPT